MKKQNREKGLTEQDLAWVSGGIKPPGGPIGDPPPPPPPGTLGGS
jgi:hypothetical protein